MDDDDGIMPSSDARGMMRLHKTRTLTLCFIGVVVLVLLVFGVTVAIGTSTGWFCHCGGDGDDENCDTRAREAYNDAVKALAGTTNTMACWDGAADNAPIMWVISEDPLGNGIPWPVATTGDVCYTTNVIPADTQSPSSSENVNGHF